MNELIVSTALQPVLCGCDCLAANEDFYLADRATEFNIAIYVDDGVMFITEGDVDYEVRSGQLLFLKQGIRHYSEQAVMRGTKWKYIYFYLQEPEEGCESFRLDTAELRNDEKICQYAVLPKKLEGLKNSRIESAFEELVQYCHSADSLKRLKINSMLNSLLVEVALKRYRDSMHEALSDKICAYLNAHCDEPFSAQKLEEEFALSYKRMAAVFKKEKAMTMQQYHTQCRMQRACYLLRSTVLPIREVAAGIGYSDPLYFSRCFQSVQGVSPRSYRLSAKVDF